MHGSRLESNLEDVVIFDPKLSDKTYTTISSEPNLDQVQIPQIDKVKYLVLTFDGKMT